MLKLTISFVTLLITSTAAFAEASDAKKASVPQAETTKAETPKADQFNAAKPTDKSRKDGLNPAILRAEVMLDRLHISPGVIDGKDGANFQHALQTFEAMNNFKTDTVLTEDVWSALTTASSEPVVIEHVLTQDDVKGPFFADLPEDYGELAKLPSIGYRNPAEKIAATFHMSETLLAALNPKTDFSAVGASILVTDVTPKPFKGKIAAIEVDKGKGQVFGLDDKGNIAVAYPATIGSEELPSPSGSYKIKGIAFNPVYYYNPDKNFLQGDNRERLKLAPGPNNPVGTVFIALTKPTFGLHGTPDPEKVDKSASHGCVRMTNWDVEELARLVKPGIVVSFKEAKS